MGLFAIDTEFVGPGMPLWLPKGTVLVEELEKLAKELLTKEVLFKSDVEALIGKRPFGEKNLLDVDDKEPHAVDGTISEGVPPYDSGITNKAHN